MTTKELHKPKIDGATINARCKTYLERKGWLNEPETLLKDLGDHADILPRVFGEDTLGRFQTHLFENAVGLLERTSYRATDLPYLVRILVCRQLENFVREAQYQYEVLGYRTVIKVEMHT